MSSREAIVQLCEWREVCGRAAALESRRGEMAGSQISSGSAGVLVALVCR